MSERVLNPNRFSATASVRQTGAVRIRTVALPVEHGGWGFTLEPILVGLLVAWSISGFFLAIATLTAFLARHPLKLVLSDRRRSRQSPRAALAEQFLVLYSAIGALAFLTAFVVAQSYDFVIPLAIAFPLVVIQIAYDRDSRSRALLAELAGAVAMAAVASSIALAGDWPMGKAFALWAILAARFVPTIFYVRTRLNRLHRRNATAAVPLSLHALAVLLALLLAWIGVASFMAVMAMLILLVRAIVGLFGDDGAMRAKQIGLYEICYGAMTVLALALGNYFNI